MWAMCEVEPDQVADEMNLLHRIGAQPLAHAVLKLFARDGCRVALVYLEARRQHITDKRIRQIDHLLGGAPFKQHRSEVEQLQPVVELIEQARFSYPGLGDDANEL